MRQFIKVTVPTEGYEEVKKLGPVYIVHLEGTEQEDGSIKCYECSMTEAPDMEQLSTELQEWKAYIAHIEQQTERQERMKVILQELADTDYIVLKRAEGIDISEYDEKYKPNFLDWRQALRDEYNQLEEQERGE